MSETILRLVEDDRLTAQDIEVAKNELNEDQSTNEEMIDKLISMMDEKPHLKNLYREKKDLLRFLRHRKFDLERTLKNIEKNCKVVWDFPEIVRFDYQPMRVFFKDNLFGGLKYRDQHGRFVYLVKMGCIEGTSCNLTELIQVTYMVSTWHVQFAPSQINGIAIIFDMRKLSWIHVSRILDVSLRKLLITLVQDTYPLRLKEMHYLFPSTLLKLVFKLLNVFLSKKMQKRMFIHEDVSTLHDYISPKILPAELGGEQPPFDGLEIYEKTKTCERIYLEDIDRILREKPVKS